MFKAIAAIQKEPIELVLPKKVIVYSNAKKRIRQIEDKIGEDLDEDDDLHLIDIIEVDGALTKIEKAFYIQEFLQPHYYFLAIIHNIHWDLVIRNAQITLK